MVWTVETSGRLHHMYRKDGTFDMQIVPDGWGQSPDRSQAELLCEALNVHEETGLTPKQILEKLKTLQGDGK